MRSPSSLLNRIHRNLYSGLANLFSTMSCSEAPRRADFFYMNQEFIHFDLSIDTRSAAIELLKQQLVDALDLGLQAKQAHWNTKGPYFQSLHERFAHIAQKTAEFSDLIAERAVQLGGAVEGTAQVIVRDSRLPVYALNIRQAAEHVRALAAALGRFSASVRLASGAASAAGDSNTADLFMQISRSAEVLLREIDPRTCESEETSDTISSLRSAGRA
jgi:starvation-inducible DNA-binding protein